MLQLFVNGPPGAGKTSLCRLLCDEFGLELVATGDLLRENILQRTPLGVVAKDCISRKSLVPDAVVVDMVAEKICGACVGRSGWVLDGFPRTPEQSAALRRKQIFPTVVVVLELSESECAKRITGRRFDPVTSKIYHLPNAMPRDATVLARLTKRSDDALDKLPPRFEAYRQHGEATNALYDGVLHRVDASRRPLHEILDVVVHLLHALRPQQPSVAAPPPRGNQSHAGLSSAMAPPPVVPVKQHAAIAGHASKRPHHPVPQKIEEEDEEQVAQEAQGEFHYDSDEPKASQPTALRGDDDLPRIDVSFRALHADVGHAMKTAANAASPSSSPSASPSASPSSSHAKATNVTETRGAYTFQSNNADATAQSAPSSPVSSGAGVASAAVVSPPPLPQPPRALSSASGVDMVKFKDLLLDGFEVLKHGRRGSPHARTIFADMEFKRVFWMKPGKETKAKKAKLDQSLLLADVVQVVRGMKTEVLKRSGDVAKYERYLSLVADDRTLDLELPSEALCEFLLRGFEHLLHGSS